MEVIFIDDITHAGSSRRCVATFSLLIYREMRQNSLGGA